MLLVQFCAEKEAERAVGFFFFSFHPSQTSIAAWCHHSLQRGRQKCWKSSPPFHQATFVSQLLSDAGENHEFAMSA